jgi:hypothetical protein
MKECELRRRVRDLGFDCDEDQCIFWDHVGPEHAAPRCAVEYFGLLGQPGQELAKWLLSLKDRADLERVLGIERERQLEED